MTIQIDTREQKNSHIIKYFDDNGIKHVTSKLYVGDYMDISNGLLCIDKKFGLDEVYSCVVTGHERFRAECVRAQENGIKLIVLIEEHAIQSLSDVHMWKNKRLDRWFLVTNAHKKGKMMGVKVAKVPPIDSKRLQTIMETMTERYGVEWLFCHKEDTGKRIIELLGGD